MTVSNLPAFGTSVRERGWRWWDDALCAEVDQGDVFFPDPGQSSKAAKRICALCPVKDPCLADALAFPAPYGIRGGLSPEERERLGGHRSHRGRRGTP